MTFKCGAADIRIGGAKDDVFFAPSSPYKGSVIADLSRALEYLQVIFTGQDMNISEEDAVLMARLAPHTIVGTPGLSMGGQEPTPPTALGVYLGMRAYAGWLWPTEAQKISPLEGRDVSIMGIGGVGFKLLEYLVRDGARVIVTDVRKEPLEQVKQRFGTAVEIEPEPGRIFERQAQIFSPNAKGAVLNGETIPKLAAAGVQLVAGAANNALANLTIHGQLLHDSKILYAPDYVINQGGLDGVAADVMGYDPMEKVRQVPTILLAIAERAKVDNIPTALAAELVISEKFTREKWQLISG